MQINLTNKTELTLVLNNLHSITELFEPYQPPLTLTYKLKPLNITHEPLPYPERIATITYKNTTYETKHQPLQSIIDSIDTDSKLTARRVCLECHYRSNAEPYEPNEANLAPLCPKCHSETELILTH